MPDAMAQPDADGPDQDAQSDGGPGALADLEGSWAISDNAVQSAFVMDNYTFEPGGRLTVWPRGQGQEPAGRVARCAQPGCPPSGDFVPECDGVSGPAPQLELRCEFAGSWRAVSVASLELGLECPDGTPRTASFALAPNGRGYQLTLQSVSGNQDWVTASSGGATCPLIMAPAEQ